MPDCIIAWDEYLFWGGICIHYMDSSIQKIIVKFNNRRQFVEVYIWQSPRKFYNRFGDCIGIYWGDAQRMPRRGKFGEIHLIQSRIDHELVPHEFLHFFIDLIRTRNGTITKRNEEKLVSEYGLMVKDFWKKYSRLTPYQS